MLESIFNSTTSYFSFLVFLVMFIAVMFIGLMITSWYVKKIVKWIKN